MQVSDLQVYLSPKEQFFLSKKLGMKKIEQEFWMEIASQNFSVIGQKIMLNSMNLDQQSVTCGTVYTLAPHNSTNKDFLNLAKVK